MHLLPPPGRTLGVLKVAGLPRQSLAAIGLFVLANLAFTPAHAESRMGQLLASQCAQCHGTNGSGFESIAGKSANSLFGDLINMKYRTVETIMDRQARAYTDYQLRLISDYYSRLPGSGSDN
jgi:sulfide dehydrogenase cytochrome subunit